MKEYVREKREYNYAMQNVYGIIRGQCSDNMVVALESHPDYENFSQASNAISLLKCIREISHDVESHRYKVLAIYEAKKKFFSLYQKKHITTNGYYEEFCAQLEVLSSLGAAVGNDVSLMNWALDESDLNYDNATPQQRLTAAANGRQAFEATAFLSGADKIRYGKLIEELENDFLKGIKNFPAPSLRPTTWFLGTRTPHAT